jgi:O-antigen/teichoic acid export membrane protein
MDISYKLFTTILMIYAIYSGKGVLALVTINAFVGLSIILIKILYTYKLKLFVLDLKIWDKSIFSEIFRFISWMTIIAISQRLIFNIVPSILGSVSNTEEISKFAISSTIEGYVWLIAAALNGLFLPIITDITTKSESNTNIESIMFTIGKYQLIIIGLIVLGFILVGKDFLYLWVGDFFDESYYITILLISPMIMIIPLQIAETTLTARGKVKYRAFGALTAGALSFFLSIFLAREYGALGPGISIFVSSMIGYVIYMNIVYVRILKLNMKKFYTKIYSKYIFVVIITGIVGVLINSLLPEISLINLLIKISVITITYLILIVCLYIEKIDRDKLWEYIKKHINH